MTEQFTTTPQSADGENSRLEEVAQWFDSRKGLNYELIKYAARKIMSCTKGPRALEMGCASGVMTEDFGRHFPRFDVVEAAGPYAEHARTLVPEGSRVYQCLFEEFEPEIQYDAIMMTWILEHVISPPEIMARAKEWLAPGGKIYIVVPHAESLHRHVGVAMGMLERVDQLNESDLAIGHRRVYTWEALATDIAAAGLKLVTMEGILLKPLASSQMEAWPAELRAAYFKLGALQPRLCSEIFAICGRADEE